MKKIYFFAVATALLTGCSKDFLKRYDDRIVGNWYISKVNRVGIGGDFGDLPFREGQFDFRGDGTLTYTDEFGNVSSGSWDIQKRNVNSNVVRTFHITTVDFATQVVRAEFYDDMHFRGTDHFVAEVNNTFRTFVTHFRR